MCITNTFVYTDTLFIFIWQALPPAASPLLVTDWLQYGFLAFSLCFNVCFFACLLCLLACLLCSRWLLDVLAVLACRACLLCCSCLLVCLLCLFICRSSGFSLEPFWYFLMARCFLRRPGWQWGSSLAWWTSVGPAGIYIYICLHHHITLHVYTIHVYHTTYAHKPQYSHMGGETQASIDFFIFGLCSGLSAETRDL